MIEKFENLILMIMLTSSLWILDSGTSHHMSPYFSSIISLSYGSSVSVMSTSSTPMPREGVGSIVTLDVSLKHVYYIHTLALNLASVSPLCKYGFLIRTTTE